VHKGNEKHIQNLFFPKFQAKRPIQTCVDVGKWY